MRRLNQRLAGLPEGIGFAFPPPAIPGIGTSGGVTFMLEDRSGQDVEFLAQNTERFLEAARQRPEFASLTTTFIPPCRRSLPTWTATRCSSRESICTGLPDLADLHGRVLRQLLQPLRPRSGRCTSRRKASSARRPTTSASSTSAINDGDRCRFRHW